MSALSSYQKYQEQSVYTLTPGELIVLLFDEAIKDVKKSILFIKKNKIIDAHNSIIKVQKIFLHLIVNLDMKYPVSKDILPLYNYILSQLVKANMKKNHIILEDILNIIVTLKNTWQEAAEKCRIKGN